MENNQKSKKVLFWSAHIGKAKQFDGGTKRYCEEHGLNLHTFKYWSQKLSSQPSSQQRSSFIPITVETSKSQNQLPDAKWVAEVIFELHKRLQ